MCKKAIVFAGTIEGRDIAEYLAEHGVETYISVATDYGVSLYKKIERLHASARRMNQAEMVSYIEEISPDIVVDATHPYAIEVTKNIQGACKMVGEMPYLRMLRDSDEAKDAIYVQSIEEAVAYLEQTSGNILLTTGSKDLAKFTRLTNYKERVYARVLSIPEVVESCAKLEIEGKHLMCMQGPFSMHMNIAMMEHVHAKYLVTKDSGSAGGFQEKYEAAYLRGIQMIVIGRPMVEEGLDYIECKKKLQKLLQIDTTPKISLVGIGVGNEAFMTHEASIVCEKAKLVIGAKRMVDTVVLGHQAVYYAYDAAEIHSYIDAHPEYEHVAIVLSGDVGFYSGAKRLIEELGDEVQVVPGISSLTYFCSKLKKSWEDVKLVSMHGRNQPVIEYVKKCEQVFAIVGNTDGISELCAQLTTYGMGQVRVWIGENLSYSEEKISYGNAEEFVQYKTDKLSVILIENENARGRVITHGIEDEKFSREKIPMTKEEVRSISISKLQLREDAVVYDIGAGTGSVSIEIAQCITKGKVFAIEKNPKAVELLHVNKNKFAASNLEIVEGLAPEVLGELPCPSHAFIGGSSGNLREIVTVLLEKNPQVRIVINAITLETVAEAMRCMETFPEGHVDIVCVNISKSKTLGSYHMMMGMNPVYVITYQQLL